MEDGITRGLKNSGKVVSGGTEELECKTENRYRVKYGYNMDMDYYGTQYGLLS